MRELQKCSVIYLKFVYQLLLFSSFSGVYFSAYSVCYQLRSMKSISFFEVSLMVEMIDRMPHVKATTV